MEISAPRENKDIPKTNKTAHRININMVLPDTSKRPNTYNKITIAVIGNTETNDSFILLKSFSFISIPPHFL